MLLLLLAACMHAAHCTYHSTYESIQNLKHAVVVCDGRRAGRRWSTTWHSLSSSVRTCSVRVRVGEVASSSRRRSSLKVSEMRPKQYRTKVQSSTILQIIILLYFPIPKSRWSIRSKELRRMEDWSRAGTDASNRAGVWSFFANDSRTEQDDNLKVKQFIYSKKPYQFNAIAPQTYVDEIPLYRNDTCKSKI